MVTITKDYIQLGIVVLMFLVFIYWDIKKYRVIKWGVWLGFWQLF